MMRKTQETMTANRRNLLIAAGSGVLASLLGSTRQTMAQVPPPTQTNSVPTDPFILLLRGIYEPVTSGPNLGLSGIKLNDGTYSKTRIYPVFGVHSAENDQGSDNNVPTAPIGTFYVQGLTTNGNLCAYELPGGAIAMSFVNPYSPPQPGFNGFVDFSDHMGGTYMEGTFELNIFDATGIYKHFKGGHNHMVDRLHQLANGQFDEFCFCNISQYPFPPCSSSTDPTNVTCAETSPPS